MTGAATWAILVRMTPKATPLASPPPFPPSLQKSNEELMALATVDSIHGTYAHMSDERVKQMASAVYIHGCGHLEAIYLAREVLALRALVVDDSDTAVAGDVG